MYRWILYLYLYITWQYALLCYRATGVTIHGLIYVPSTPCFGFFGARRMETVPTSIEVLLRGSLIPTSVYSTWQSQAVTHPIMNRARRCLTSVIEHKPFSERRIPDLD